jgi:hypothetical protein
VSVAVTTARTAKLGWMSRTGHGCMRRVHVPRKWVVLMSKRTRDRWEAIGAYALASIAW